MPEAFPPGLSLSLGPLSPQVIDFLMDGEAEWPCVCAWQLSVLTDACANVFVSCCCGGEGRVMVVVMIVVMTV